MGTELQSRNAALRVSVRQRIERGRLPVVRPAQIAAGYGTGLLCEVCDHPITARQAEYEVEDSQTGRKLRFHSDCHAAWQFECAHLLPVTEYSLPGQAR